MGNVIAYKNNNSQCFCQIKLDNRERILISIAGTPTPSIKVFKLLWGMIPIKSIWKLSSTMAGGYDTYIKKVIAMFITAKDKNDMKHPLDAIRDKLLPCQSVEEVLQVLIDAEKRV